MPNIKQEADEFLRDNHLLEILGKYGKPFIHGSYLLDLMTWRDLDIYIETDDVSTERFFDLGKELERQLSPFEMYFNNRRLYPDDTRPDGYYWGIHTKPKNSEGAWKMDIWVMNSAEKEKWSTQIYALKEKITPEKRNIILDIKTEYCTHKSYANSFGSVDIYNAVLSNDVTSREQFKKWIKETKGMEL